MPFQATAAQDKPRRGPAIVLAWVATIVAIVALGIAVLALGRSVSANRAAQSAMSNAAAASNEIQSLRDDNNHESDPLANHSDAVTPTSAPDTTSEPSTTSHCVRAQGGQVTVRTTNFDFDPPCLTVDSAELTVVYGNEEKGVKHNIDFKGVDGSADGTASTQLVAGPSTQSVTLTNLTPGTYTFICDIHANMRGTLIVGDG